MIVGSAPSWWGLNEVNEKVGGLSAGLLVTLISKSKVVVLIHAFLYFDLFVVSSLD